MRLDAMRPIHSTARNTGVVVEARALSHSHKPVHIHTLGWRSRLAGHGEAGDDAGDDAGEKAGLGVGCWE